MIIDISLHLSLPHPSPRFHFTPQCNANDDNNYCKSNLKTIMLLNLHIIQFHVLIPKYLFMHSNWCLHRVRRQKNKQKFASNINKSFGVSNFFSRLFVKWVALSASHKYLAREKNLLEKKIISIAFRDLFILENYDKNIFISLFMGLELLINLR